MRILAAIALISFDLIISAQSYYGTPIGANSLANIQTGKYIDQEVDYRFRAENSGSVTKILVFVATGPGYSSGNGGILKLNLETDDGTSKHLPSGSVLTSVTDNDPQHWGEKWPGGAIALYTFDYPANLAEGNLYHIRWKNLAKDNVNNYVSANMLCSTSGTFDRIPVISITDLAVLRYEDHSWKEQDYYTPIYTLFYSDGKKQGQGYIYAGVNYPNNISGNNYKVRSNITVSGSDIIVNKVWTRLKKISGSENLNIRLESSNGNLIEEVTIGSSEITGKMGWVSKEFLTNHNLSMGMSYHVVLSTGPNTTYQTFWLQEGSSYFGHIEMFPDGYYQYTTNGGTNWNGSAIYKAFVFFEKANNSFPPKYMSSSINNSNPSVIELKYSTILDASLPPSSAYTILVNGIMTNVSTVEITESNVLLTLTKPVAYGDIVTVTYAKPLYNGIKTPYGIDADSFSNQIVENHVFDCKHQLMITLFPNPVQNYLNISVLSNINIIPAIIKIADFSGKTVFKNKIYSNSEEIKIPESIASDIYIFQLCSDKQILNTQKIIINR
jgi:hypothetical protein